MMMVYSYLAVVADGIPNYEFCLIFMPILHNRETAMVPVLAVSTLESDV